MKGSVANSTLSPRNKRARVLVLLTDAYGGHGGIAAYNRDVLQALCEDENVAEVVAIPRLISGPVGKLPTKLRFKIEAAEGTVAYLRSVAAELVKPRYDLIYCAHINLVPLAWLASHLTATKWALAIYGIEAWQPSSRRVVNKFAGKASLYLSISQLTLDRFRSWCPIGEQRCVLMPNAVHMNEFGMRPRNGAMSERLGLNGGGKTLQTLARMDPLNQYKGFDEVLDLMPRLLRSVPSLKYILAGDGADRPRLEAKARQLGLGDHTVFTGFVSEEEKPLLYGLADAFVMPSYGEGFGFVLIEALASGVPVVASQIDGGREAVRGGILGRLVDPHNPDEVEEGILEALRKPKEVPQELEYFAYPRFKKRLQNAVHSLIGPPLPDRSSRC